VQCGVRCEVRISCAAAWLLCTWSGLAVSRCFSWNLYQALCQALCLRARHDACTSLNAEDLECASDGNSARSCRECELFQALKDNEMAQAMLANVKLSMPGMQKAVQGQKKAKKAKGK
jgi:hypothetical protein